MTVSEITAPSRYSRRLAGSLVIALGLHVLLLLFPFYRWLGDRPGESDGIGAGRRSFPGELLGTAVTIRNPRATPQDTPNPVEPSPPPVTIAPEAEAANDPVAAEADDLDLDDMPPVVVGGAPRRSGSPDAAGNVVGGSLRPLEGGGNAQIEMAVEPRVQKWPDPLADLVLKRKIQDEVVLQVLVDRDGLVLDSRVLRSIRRCPECTASATEAAMAWQFEQPTYEGERVQAWVTLRFRFGPDAR